MKKKRSRKKRGGGRVKIDLVEERSRWVEAMRQDRLYRLSRIQRHP